MDSEQTELHRGPREVEDAAELVTKGSVPDRVHVVVELVGSRKDRRKSFLCRVDVGLGKKAGQERVAMLPPVGTGLLQVHHINLPSRRRLQFGIPGRPGRPWPSRDDKPRLGAADDHPLMIPP